MKDTFGSAFSFVLFMGFFVVFVCFLAVSISFTKAYRVKNGVINILEQYDYNGGTIGDSSSVGLALGNYLDDVGYSGVAMACSGENFKEVCITPVEFEGSDAKYFKVTVYFNYNFGILGASGTIPVSGETRTIQ